MNQEYEIIALNRRLQKIEDMLYRSSYGERPAKIHDIVNLRCWVEREYISKHEITNLIYTKEEADKIFQKRTLVDRVFVKNKKVSNKDKEKP